MALKEREILELAERVESLTNKMGELEYDKNVTKRMRNVILREFGKRVEDIKIEPFEVMLKRVQDKTVQTVKQDLAVELNKNFETVLVQLMKEFRSDFTREQDKRDKDNKQTITTFSREMTDMKNILEKKVALMEEEMFKKSTEMDSDMEGLSKSIKEAMKGIKIKVSALDEKLSGHTDRLKAMTDDSALLSKRIDKVNKDVHDQNPQKELNYLGKRLDSELSKIATDISSLRAFDKTIIEKDIAKIWDEIESVKSDTTVEALRKAIEDKDQELNSIRSDLQSTKDRMAKTAEAKDKQLEDLKAGLEDAKGRIAKASDLKPAIKKLLPKLSPKKDTKEASRMEDLEKLINDAFKIGRGKQ